MYAGQSRNITLSIRNPRSPPQAVECAFADSEGRTASLIQAPARTLPFVRDLPVLLDRLEEADGAAEPVPSADGWELVLAENVAYLVDDERRWRAGSRGVGPVRAVRWTRGTWRTWPA
jgi:hypothetical protein